MELRSVGDFWELGGLRRGQFGNETRNQFGTFHFQNRKTLPAVMQNFNSNF